ncbi:MAG: hypothetical protein NC038_07120 [Paludibacter sp.]|nr:hypothetical protein [Bacteroidales bacterium]MCM1069659.1 hypothetical protein [Prevotella sp.]MCM1354305.1 hypothetical protein [Bacteroides sp.]MCM1443156.1 hypothetical protein [Muribaculum sp.]MCM1482391.1 hypothetical protein [Paludibacter sp.]
MKTKLVIYLLLLSSYCFAQNDSILNLINTKLETLSSQLEALDIDLSLKNRYKLYQTENLYNFLKLDSRTGRIWQVQWNLNRDNEGTWIINDTDLSSYQEYGSNSFELYPTQNMYQFLLIDKTNGRMWHVQWGTKGDDSRWIRRIWD